MIEVHLCSEIRPGWAMKPADRYHSIPDWCSAAIQCADDPVNIYIVRGQKLPESIEEAVQMIAAWRAENARATD